MVVAVSVCLDARIAGTELPLPSCPGPAALTACCAVLCLLRTLCCVQVKGMLEEYRIGRLKGGQAAGAGADPYANEPQRLPALIVRTQKPMNSGG